MAVRTTNPETLHAPIGYRHLAAGSGTVVFVAGQVALDAEGNLVGEGDLAAQAGQAYRNFATALASANLSVQDVAKLTTFVVGYRPELLAHIREAREAEFRDHLPASTLVGVQALARPEFLIEVEAVAIADG